MASRLELQSKLEELLGSRNVYFNPPENLKMEYDAIRYSEQVMRVRHANNKKYSKMKCYNLIVITKKSNPKVVDDILELPYSSLDRPYKSDNLNHYPITLYW